VVDYQRPAWPRRSTDPTIPGNAPRVAYQAPRLRRPWAVARAGDSTTSQALAGLQGAGACIDKACTLSGISIDDGWTVRAAGVRLSRSRGAVLALAASALAGALPLRRDDQQSAAAWCVIATITAVVLGLLISSVKGSFDLASRDVQALAADVIVLDRTLHLYGPNVILKEGYESKIPRICRLS